jgi:hypothetical protein
MNQEEIENKREQKQKLQRKAATDSLFNTDIEEIKEDFRFSDKEAMVFFQKKISGTNN